MEATATALPTLPRLDTATLDGTRFDRTLERIPVLGWTWADLRWKSRASSIIREIHTLLANRSIETVALFGDDPSLRDTAATLATIAAREIGWPNDRFLPDDPLATVLWAHEDGLDDMAAIQSIETTIGIELPLEWVESQWSGPWGDFVNAIHRKRFPLGFGSTAFPPDAEKP
jgi:hypothetical protein